MKRWTVAVLGIVLFLALGAVVASSEEAKEPEGKTLFLSNKCNSCHTIEAVGVEKKSSSEEKSDSTAATTAATSKKKPPDLSSVGLDVKADWMTKYLKKLETTKDGKKHMKLWKGTDEELASLTSWLETMKAEKKAADKAADSGEKAEKAPEKAPEKTEDAETK